MLAGHGPLACGAGVQYPLDSILCEGQSYRAALDLVLLPVPAAAEGGLWESGTCSLNGVAYSGSGGRGSAYSGRLPGLS